MTAARPDTWMPIYWGDYARDTGHLSATMHGAYLMLIKHYWSTGTPLADDDKQLWRIACCDSIGAWRKIRPTIEKFFTVAERTWRHHRVDKELTRAVEITDKRAAAGRASAQQRSNKNPTHVEQVVRVCTQQTGIPSHLPSLSKEDSDASASASPSDSPLDLKREIWRRGRALFAQRGVPESKSGPLFGKWRRDYHDTDILDALTAAEVEVAQDIIPFMVACLTRSASGKRSGSKSSLGRANGLAEGLAGALVAFGVESGGACSGEQRADFAGDAGGAIVIDAERSEGSGGAARANA